MNKSRQVKNADFFCFLGILFLYIIRCITWLRAARRIFLCFFAKKSLNCFGGSEKVLTFASAFAQKRVTSAKERVL